MPVLVLVPMLVPVPVLVLVPVPWLDEILSEVSCVCFFFDVGRNCAKINVV